MPRACQNIADLPYGLAGATGQLFEGEERLVEVDDADLCCNVT